MSLDILELNELFDKNRSDKMHHGVKQLHHQLPIWFLHNNNVHNGKRKKKKKKKKKT